MSNSSTSPVKPAPKSLKRPKSFTIDCKKWARGGENDTSLLSSDTGKMCCLGFYSLACGLSKNDITDASDPVSLVVNGGVCKVVPGMTRGRYLTQAGTKAISINDDAAYDDAVEADLERITKLTALFKRIGVKVKFTNIPKAHA